jgi:hypothetical protein
MTLMKRLFKLWERHLSAQIAYLIKKSFSKHVMQTMVQDYERKGFYRLKLWENNIGDQMKFKQVN